MPTIPIYFYVTDSEYILFLKMKKEIQTIVKEKVKEIINKRVKQCKSE